jgi:hypothetical protein
MPQPANGLDARTVGLLRASEVLIERSAALAAYSSKVSKAMHQLLQRSEDVVRASRRVHSRRVDPDQG